MKSLKWMISYCIFAVLGLFTAFYVISGIVKPAQSQTELPPSGDLPADFANPENGMQMPSNNSVPPPPPASMDMDVDSVTAPTTPIFTDVNYTYSAEGKRDPFEPYRKRTGLIQKKVEVEITDPLQLHTLDKFTLIGILWDVNKPRAMVRDPDGRVYVIVKNTRIGRNEGYVAAIREGEVVVIETFYDEGNGTKQSAILSLKK